MEIPNIVAIPIRLCYSVFMDNIRKNQILRVTIDAYSSDAAGICHVDGLAVFVPGTIVGEEWEIRILKVQKSCAWAKGETLLRPSPARIDPACPCYGKCGGCDCRHMSYEEELRFKLAKVNDALRRIGRQSVMAQEIIGSEKIESYRNKGILAVGSVDGEAVSGFYRERSHQIIPVERCAIQDELTHRAAAALTGFMKQNGIAAYDEQRGTGAMSSTAAPGRHRIGCCASSPARASATGQRRWSMRCAPRAPSSRALC